MTNSSDNSVTIIEQNINGLPNTVALIQSKSGINMEQITQAMIPKAIDLIFRTVQRISHEIQIVADLERFLKEHNFDLKVMPFGSATYGFGGSNTDFNICLLNNGGNKIVYIRFGSTVKFTFLLNTGYIHFSGDASQNNINNVFESFAKSFEESTGFMISNRIAPRGLKSRLTAIHNASGISCTLQIDANANKIESSQIIRNCLLHSPICKYISD